MNCECLNMKDKNSRGLIVEGAPQLCEIFLLELELVLTVTIRKIFHCTFFFLFNFIYLFVYYYFFTLQYCIGFAIHQHASSMGVHVFPILNPLPSPYHPTGSSQCPSPKLPVSCIESGLAIRFLYDIIHVLMPFSQIIPLSLSHRVQKTVLYICVSFAVSHTGLSLPSF